MIKQQWRKREVHLGGAWNNSRKADDEYNAPQWIIIFRHP